MPPSDHDRIVRLEALMEPAMQEIASHGKRISALERKWFWAVGAFSGAGFVGSLLGGLLASLLLKDN